MSLCYFSANPWIKWYIHRRWRGDIHFVWCSEVFDPREMGASHYGSLIPPTSSPQAIYKDLADAVRTRDKHNAKIVGQKAATLTRVEEWRLGGEVSEAVANEIVSILSGDDLSIWRPLLYVIPKGLINDARVTAVPYAQRAGLGDEFQIKDLSGSEFERITFDGV